MKIIAIGDLHARDRAPRCRKDDYQVAFYNKLRWVSEKVDGNSLVVFPGDVFHSHKVGFGTCTDLYNAFRRLIGAGVPLCVAGQHDQRYHTTNLHGTPLGFLRACSAVRLLDADPTYYWDDVGMDLHFYGASWGEELPVPDDVWPTPERLQVLIIHKMLSNADYWNGHLEYSDALAFLKSQPYDLIISGDNHNAFMVEYQGRYLINCGSFMRNSIDQVDHEPMIGIYDTLTRKLEVRYVPIEPAEDIIETEARAEEVRRNLELEQFVETLRTGERPELNFVANVRKLVAGTTDTELEGILMEALFTK